MGDHLVLFDLTFAPVRLDMPAQSNHWVPRRREELKMAKTVNGKTYRTIADVTKELRTSVKTINKLVADGTLPAPEVVENGGAPFRTYDDNFIEAGKTHFKQKAEQARQKATTDKS